MIVLDPELELGQYTIYQGLPGAPFVVREWIIRPGVGEPVPSWVFGARTLAGARALLPVRADYRLPRTDGDDPSIVETWT